MGIFDKAKDALSQHPDQVDRVLDQAAEQVDRRTGHQHGEQIDRGADVVKDQLAERLRRDDPPA